VNQRGKEIERNITGKVKWVRPKFGKVMEEKKDILSNNKKSKFDISTNKMGNRTI
jgi:hypothetical protein